MPIPQSIDESKGPGIGLFDAGIGAGIPTTASVNIDYFGGVRSPVGLQAGNRIGGLLGKCGKGSAREACQNQGTDEISRRSEPRRTSGSSGLFGSFKHDGAGPENVLGHMSASSKPDSP